MKTLSDIPGIFTVSLDFELHWGNFDKWEANDFKDYFIRTREQAIPGILQRFEKSGTHCTWATVGALMLDGRDRLEAYRPAVWPTYSQPHLGMEYFLNEKGVGINETEDPFHFAPGVVAQIIKAEGQELATHTFAHYFCNEPGQTIEAFEADINAAIRVQQVHWASVPRSIVFPRNQFRQEHVEICAQQGITAIRSNPDVWWWRITTPSDETRVRRLVRGADAYWKIGGPFSYPLNTVKKEWGCWHLPASRLLRPYSSRFNRLEQNRIQRICKEMTYAARHQQVYHLWWHPHNFGFNTIENLNALEVILQHFEKLKREEGMISLHMAETASLLDGAAFYSKGK